MRIAAGEVAGRPPAAAERHARAATGEQVQAHEPGGRLEDADQPRIGQLANLRARMHPHLEEHLALIDVADAGGDALVE